MRQTMSAGLVAAALFASFLPARRASRVMTETDAFGRKRVARARNGKAIRDSRVKAKAS